LHSPVLLLVYVLLLASLLLLTSVLLHLSLLLLVSLLLLKFPLLLHGVTDFAGVSAAADAVSIEAFFLQDFLSFFKAVLF
jgi:hypothetical protein